LRSRLRWALALCLIALAAGTVVVAAGCRDVAACDAPPSVVSLEADGFRYEYHVPTATEAIYDLRADPQRIRNVAEENAARARRMRRALETRLEVASLEELRGEYADTIRRLRSLGYL
jgi:hypothetical protein